MLGFKEDNTLESEEPLSVDTTGKTEPEVSGNLTEQLSSDATEGVIEKTDNEILPKDEYQSEKQEETAAPNLEESSSIENSLTEEENRMLCYREHDKWYQSRSDPSEWPEEIIEDIHWRMTQTALIIVSDVVCPITENILHQVFDSFGAIEEINVLPAKDNTFQALLRFRSIVSVSSSIHSLNGCNIYDQGCKLEVKHLSKKFFDELGAQNPLGEGIDGDVFKSLKEMAMAEDKVIEWVQESELRRKNSNKEGVVKGMINPRSLYGSLCTKAPQFKGFQQHDSHELLRCLIDGLSNEELNTRKRGKAASDEEATSINDLTFVDVILGGKLASTVTGLECGHLSTTHEPVLDLSLSVPTKKPQSVKMQPVTRGDPYLVEKGRQLHLHFIKEGLKLNVVTLSYLIKMFSKCSGLYVRLMSFSVKTDELLGKVKKRKIPGASFVVTMFILRIDPWGQGSSKGGRNVMTLKLQEESAARSQGRKEARRRTN